MEHVILVIHLILTLSLIGLILLQRSEGGGLGIGSSGGGMGSFASAHSTANVLTKATQIIAGCFFATSLILAVMASHRGAPSSILDNSAAPTAIEKSSGTGNGAAAPAKAPAVPISE